MPIILCEFPIKAARAVCRQDNISHGEIKGRSFLVVFEKISREPDMAKHDAASEPLDKFDRAILDLVQRDNTTPLRLMAEQVNLSTAAVQRRIKRMEERGVITGNVAIVDPTAVGRPITIIVEVMAERTSIEALGAMKAHFAVPEVQQCYYVTGEVDFVLVLTVASMQEYQALARRLFAENANVTWFKTIVALDRVKVGLDVPSVPGH
jgi:DNA-binding Lrp family transcriptional regulator